MNPKMAAFLLMSAAGIWIHQATAVATQDLRLRPVGLAAFREEPLPDAKALPLLEAAVSGVDGRADALLRFGERLDQSGDPEAVARAGDLYRKAARAFPAWGLGQYRLAMGLLRSGDEANCRHHLRVAAGASGNHAALLTHLGDWHRDLWVKAGDPAALLASVEFYRQAVLRDRTLLKTVYAALDGILRGPGDLRAVTPDDPEGLAELGLHLVREGDAGEALRILEALPPGAGSEPEVLEARARCLLRLGRPAEAAVLFDGLIDAADPEDRFAVLNRVEAALRGLPHENRTAFFAKRAATDPFAALALARALASAGDVAGARAAVDGALLLLRTGDGLPRNASERTALMACYVMRTEDWIQRKSPLQAAAEAEQAARLEDTPARWRWAARLYADGGDEAGTRSCYERALRALPEGKGPEREALERERSLRLTRLARGGRR